MSNIQKEIEDAKMDFIGGACLVAVVLGISIAIISGILRAAGV